MAIAFLDCCSGISGDMFLGALLAAGLDPAFVQELPRRFGLAGVTVTVEERRQGGFLGLGVRVAGGGGVCPDLAAAQALLDRGDLDPAWRERAGQVFTALAAAEGRVHGRQPAEVHFHEVASADTLIDVVGVTGGLARLGVEELYVSPLPLGRGWSSSAHGPMPLPPPAVLQLLAGVPVYEEPVAMELVTPTGAALVRTLATGFGGMPAMEPAAVGCGMGRRERPDKRPNLARLLVGRSLAVAESLRVEVVETVVDDFPGELCGHVTDELLAAGALDVLWLPGTGKKGRPALLLRVVATPETAGQLKERILAETTTLGVVAREGARTVLARRQRTVTTPWGAMEVKEVRTREGWQPRPEFESCRRLARRAGVPLRLIYDYVAGLAAGEPGGHQGGDDALG